MFEVKLGALVLGLDFARVQALEQALELSVTEMAGQMAAGKMRYSSMVRMAAICAGREVEPVLGDVLLEQGFCALAEALGLLLCRMFEAGEAGDLRGEVAQLSARFPD
ncbi:MAG: hypothetical protein K2Q01_04980 [Rickettsiales bacterium]|nr:hypothetical protein [Rickettsiales bacterium]